MLEDSPSKVSDRSIRSRLSLIDWGFIKGISLNAVAIGLGRILGFAFSFFAARAFSASEFGYITYIIAMASIVAIVAQPFGQHIIAYFVGKYNQDEKEFPRFASNLWSLMLIIYVLTVIISIPILQALQIFSIEILIVYTGIVAFYLYYGIASGFLASSRLVAVYIGSNIVQTILIVAAIFLFEIRNPAIIIAIYGFAYFLPIALLSKIAPLPISIRFSLDTFYIKSILKFSIPILISHALFVGYTSADIILLSLFSDNVAIGIYGLTSTLVSVFGFIPNGINILLMPKIAGMASGRKNILLISLFIVVIISLVGLIIYLLLYEWFIRNLFGESYFLNLEFAVIMALVSIAGGIHSVLTSAFVGIGRPVYQTVNQMLMLIVVLISGFILISQYDVMGAAIARLIGVTIGIFLYLISIWKFRRERASSKIKS